MSPEEFRSKKRVIWAGIDMGVASTGLCLVDILNHEIVLMASHLFKSPVVDKKKATAAPESLASVRCQARSVRRNIMREGRRKKAIRAVLAEFGLIPADAGGEWFGARRDERTVVMLRSKGLGHLLNSRELARVLYAFASHRGYIDHGKSDKDDDAGKVKKALAANRAALTDDEVEAIIDLPYSARLFSGYANASLEAIQMLRGMFEDPHIMKLKQAEAESGLAQLRAMLADERRESADGLLCPFSDYDPTCNNPVVLHAAAQVRRMVNSAIRHYGLPDVIRVEVARDLKRSKHERKIVDESNKARLELNERAKKDIVEFLGLPDDHHVRGRDLAMVKLYREQGGKDPYTGAGIDFRRMLEEHGYAEIDHILPISRTCDDSQGM